MGYMESESALQWVKVINDPYITKGSVDEFVSAAIDLSPSVRGVFLPEEQFKNPLETLQNTKLMMRLQRLTFEGVQRLGTNSLEMISQQYNCPVPMIPQSSEQYMNMQIFNYAALFALIDEAIDQGVSPLDVIAHLNF